MLGNNNILDISITKRIPMVRENGKAGSAVGHDSIFVEVLCFKHNVHQSQRRVPHREIERQ
jgi:hypothetical protein